MTRTRKAMHEPEQDVVTNLPRPEPVIRQQTGSAPGTTVFGVSNVSIWYSSFQAVTDVSMEIHEHEITALIGSSGAARRRCSGHSTG
jgi:ABC-type glutathione transport system ATPase component